MNRRRVKKYLKDMVRGTDGGYYGPESPADLAAANRKLTPEEQKAVTEYQSKQGDAALTAQRAQGGPQSQTVSVTPQGAVIKTPGSGSGMPWWQYALLGVGGLAVVLGIGSLVTDKGGRRARG